MVRSPSCPRLTVNGRLCGPRGHGGKGSFGVGAAGDAGEEEGGVAEHRPQRGLSSGSRLGRGTLPGYPHRWHARESAKRGKVLQKVARRQ